MANNRNQQDMSLSIKKPEYIPDVILPRVIFTQAMFEFTSDNTATEVMSKLSRTCQYYHQFFQPALTKIAIKNLLLAVIDDNRETVKRILNGNPTLLLLDEEDFNKLFPKGLIIESQCTFQKLYAQNALTMAVERRQIEMIKALLPYYDMIENQEAAFNSKIKSLRAWPRFERYKIGVHNAYSLYIQSIINVLEQEVFEDDLLSQQTEIVLEKLLDDFLNKTISLNDNKYDMESLLAAAYKAFVDNKLTHKNIKIQNLFSIRVIGLIQSMLPPEIAKMFCDGFYTTFDSLRNHTTTPVSPTAAKNQLKTGENFYRENCKTMKGLGFEYMCGLDGTMEQTEGGAAGWGHPIFYYYVELKNKQFFKLLQQEEKRYKEFEEQQERCIPF